MLLNLALADADSDAQLHDLVDAHGEDLHLWRVKGAELHGAAIARAADYAAQYADAGDP
eukprot:gene43879-43389_t